MKSIYLVCSLLFIMTSFLQAQFSGSLYSDVKGYKVGDILSIIVVETADASRESKSSSSSNAGANTSASVSGDVTDLTPSFGFNTSWEDSYKGAEGTEQRERLTGRISVKIVEQLESGILKIEGDRTVEVNGEVNTMTLLGFVRPRDIMSNNTVYSYNIADAKITYNDGNFVDKIAPQGTFPKIISGILGIAVLAVASGLLIF